MLAITRKIGESFIINGNIKVTIVSSSRNQVRINIDAPRDIPVHREEVQERIDAGVPWPRK